MGNHRLFMALALVIPLIVVALPTAAAEPCQANPCVNAEWFECGSGPANPLNCDHVCYTTHWDPPPPPDDFWFSQTFCLPMLGGPPT